MSRISKIAKHTEDFYQKKFDEFVDKGGDPAALGFIGKDGKVNLDKFASSYDIYSNERAAGGNRGHKSITDILTYWSKYNTSAGDAMRRQKEINNVINKFGNDDLDDDQIANLQTITREDLKKMDSKQYTQFLLYNGIDPGLIYRQAKAQGMTSAEAARYVSVNLYGSK